LARPPHRFLEAAEGGLVPFEALTAQAQQEGALTGGELSAQQLQMFVHMLIIPDRVITARVQAATEGVRTKVSQLRSRAFCASRSAVCAARARGAGRRVSRNEQVVGSIPTGGSRSSDGQPLLQPAKAEIPPAERALERVGERQAGL